MPAHSSDRPEVQLATFFETYPDVFDLPMQEEDSFPFPSVDVAAAETVWNNTDQTEEWDYRSDVQPPSYHTPIFDSAYPPQTDLDPIWPHTPPDPSWKRTTQVVKWPAPGAADPLPPPDCLGFYLPFHRYYRPRKTTQIWGIYLMASAIRGFGGWLHAESGGRVPLASCRVIAEKFVYLHEYFHHRAESLGTRLEVASGGTRIYQGWISRKFNSGMSRRPPESLEEALAMSHALQEWSSRVKGLIPPLSRSQLLLLHRLLRAYTLRLGAPYAAGLEYLTEERWREGLGFLCEDYRQDLPYHPGTPPEHRAWILAPFMTRGINTVDQRFWYLWDLPGRPKFGVGP